MALFAVTVLWMFTVAVAVRFWLRARAWKRLLDRACAMADRCAEELVGMESDRGHEEVGHAN